MIQYLKVKPLPPELQGWRDRIEKIASEQGLDFFPTIFEVVDYDKMNEIAAYDGFPTRYPHWRFGMSYEQLSKSYAYGLSKIYELVINTNPCYAYLLEGNELVDQKLVMAHVYGHCDFFKNNFWFSRTERKMIDVLANHASRIRKYQDLYGYNHVEDFIDTCLSLDNLIDFHRPYRPIEQLQDVKKKQDLPDELIGGREDLPRLRTKDYMDDFVNTEGYLQAQADRKQAEMERLQRHPVEPERDVLLFLMENAPLTRWQRNIIEMIRAEAYYFAPQRCTKIMNEGWASFWHTNIMTRSGILDDSEVIDYADRHSGTVVAHRGKINPYRLGLELFRDIFDRWNTGKFGRDYNDCDDMAARESWNTNAGLGKEKVFEVRKHHNDLTFLDEFLTPEFCAKQKLFTFENNPRARAWQIASLDFKKVKQKLLGQLTNMGQPLIEVLDAKFEGREELLLIHRFDNVELDDQYTEPTLKNLYKIWKRPVHLITQRKQKRSEDTKTIKILFNGEKLEESPFDSPQE
jgi:stage V sporulation protein R